MRIYSALLFVITDFIIVGRTRGIGVATGYVFIRSFSIYLASVAYAVYKGVLDRPEDLESDNSDDSNDNVSSVSYLEGLCSSRPDFGSIFSSGKKKQYSIYCFLEGVWFELADLTQRREVAPCVGHFQCAFGLYWCEAPGSKQT
jgi:hypothetical protein